MVEDCRSTVQIAASGEMMWTEVYIFFYRLRNHVTQLVNSWNVERAEDVLRIAAEATQVCPSVSRAVLRDAAGLLPLPWAICCALSLRQSMFVHFVPHSHRGLLPACGCCCSVAEASAALVVLVLCMRQLCNKQRHRLRCLARSRQKYVQHGA